MTSDIMDDDPAAGSGRAINATWEEIKSRNEELAEADLGESQDEDVAPDLNEEPMIDDVGGRPAGIAGDDPISEDQTVDGVEDIADNFPADDVSDPDAPLEIPINEHIPGVRRETML
jgi:hypothetical protein